MTQMYVLDHPLDKSYAKALQLINVRTDLAWKYLKESKHAKASQMIDLIGEVADDFLTKLELDEKMRTKPKAVAVKKIAKTVKKKVVRKK